MQTIPVSALELGIGFEEYEEVARNIIRMDSISGETRQEILDRANEEFLPEIIHKILNLQTDMAYDREIYKLAELDYASGPPEGKGLFTTAVADYLLRHKDLIPTKAF